MLSPTCRKTVEKLLKSATTHQNRSALEDYVRCQTETPSWDTFLFSERELRQKYWEALDALHKELVPNHISLQDLFAILWDLFKEVTLNWRRYQTKGDWEKTLEQFGASAMRPLDDFDIMYEIRGLDMGDIALNLGSVEVFNLTTASLTDLFVKVGGQSAPNHILEAWAGKTVAKLRVKVSDMDRAYESGTDVINGVLDILRLAAAKEELSSLDDALFQWKLGARIVVPVAPKGDQLLRLNYPHNSRPLGISKGSAIQKGIQNEDTWTYILDGNLPQDIDVRLKRAARLVSGAIASDGLDYKLVYCL